MKTLRVPRTKMMMMMMIVMTMIIIIVIFHIERAGFWYFCQFYHDYKSYALPSNSEKFHDFTPSPPAPSL